MNVLSLCSGGGLGDLGLTRAGLTIVAACEIEPHARAVLRHHNPTARIYHDIAEVTRDRLDADGIGAIDLVVGGTPCQDLSVAGGRAGLAGEQSRLFHEFVRVADDVAPTWVLWENVDGALSCTGGEDFAVVLGGLSGYRPAIPAGGWRAGGVCQGGKRTVAWRVLDARGFGVPHRRRRVFALGCVGALEARAVEVLFEPEASGRDSASRRKEGPEAPAEAGRGVAAFGSGGGMSDAPTLTTKDRNDADSEAFVVVSALDTGQGGGGRQRRSGWAPRCAAPLLAKNGGSRTTDIDGGTYVIEPVAIAENQRGEVVESDYTHALSTGGGKPGAGYAAVVQTMRDVRTNGKAQAVMFHASQDPISSSSSPAMSGRDVIGVHHDEIVRRLTPIERDRLMGLPDDYTRWGTYDDGEVREVAMTNRDRITGNGIVANVTEWIGRRLLAPAAAAPARVPAPARTAWRCLYCHRGYVAAIDHQPNRAACPACGADLEENP